MIGIVIVWIIAIVYGTQKGFQIFLIPPGIFVAFVAWIGIVMIINCVAVANVKDLIAESKNKIMPYVQARNQAMKGKGYLWVTPIQFPYWLEL